MPILGSIIKSAIDLRSKIPFNSLKPKPFIAQKRTLKRLLRKAGLDVRQQHPIQVFDEDGTLIGDYLADLLVEGELIVELKTAKALANEHKAQILGYLKSARLAHGLLINFGSYKFEIRKFALTENQPQRTQRFLGLLAFALSAFFAVK